MGVVNRVINILVLLFAIVAVVFAFLLFNKREQLVSGWDRMAKSISDTAKSLDSNSGTKLANDLDVKKIDHLKFENLATALPKLNKGATEVVKERDSLADGIKDMAIKLEIPVGEDDSKALKEVASSEIKKADIAAKVAKVQERSQGIINEVVASSRRINLNIDEASLKDVDNFRDPLNKFSSRVEFVKKQDDAYASFITQVASMLGASNVNLSDGSYQSALAQTSVYISNYKSQFEQTKRDLALEKTRTRDLNTQVASKDKQIEGLNDLVKKKEEVIANLNKIINPDGSSGEGLKIVKGGSVEALKLIKGQIVEIDPKWDFVVVNVGNLTKVTQKLGQKDNIIDAPLPKDKSMTVARGLSATPEFIAKIKIAKVYDNCAIANVMPSPKGSGAVKVGDIVFFSDDDLAAAPEDKKN